jgi:purine nucleoside permease
MRRLIATAAALALVLGLTLAGTAAADNGRREVRALILATFGGEETPLLREHPGYRTLPPVGGELSPVHCWPSRRICSTVTGGTKSNAGIGTLATLRDPRLRFNRHTLFVEVGIAGISSAAGTLGDVGVAYRDVDVDLGSYFVDPADGGTYPTTGFIPGYRRFSSYEEAVTQLNRTLANRALTLAAKVPLADTDTARAERAHYPNPRAPKVLQCDSLGSDGFFVGQTKAAQLHQVFTDRVAEVEPGYRYGCSLSNFEGPAILSALERLGYLPQTVALHSASDLENSRPGETDLDQYRRVAIPPEGRAEFAGFDDTGAPAAVNHCRVAWELANRLKV